MSRICLDPDLNKPGKEKKRYFGANLGDRIIRWGPDVIMTGWLGQKTYVLLGDVRWSMEGWNDRISGICFKTYQEGEKGKEKKGTKQMGKISITELKLEGSLFYSCTCSKAFIIKKINFKKLKTLKRHQKTASKNFPPYLLL